MHACARVFVRDIGVYNGLGILVYKTYDKEHVFAVDLSNRSKLSRFSCLYMLYPHYNVY